MSRHKILHSYKDFKNEVTNRRGKKGPFLKLKKFLHNKRPYDPSRPLFVLKPKA